jgi:hypothetical protein
MVCRQQTAVTMIGSFQASMPERHSPPRPASAVVAAATIVIAAILPPSCRRWRMPATFVDDVHVARRALTPALLPPA